MPVKQMEHQSYLEACRLGTHQELDCIEITSTMAYLVEGQNLQGWWYWDVPALTDVWCSVRGCCVAHFVQGHDYYVCAEFTKWINHDIAALNCDVSWFQLRYQYRHQALTIVCVSCDVLSVVEYFVWTWLLCMCHRMNQWIVTRDVSWALVPYQRHSNSCDLVIWIKLVLLVEFCSYHRKQMFR